MSLFRIIAFTSLTIVCLVTISLHESTHTETVRDFGVVGGPNTVSQWASLTGAQPTMPAEFEAWSKQRTLSGNFLKATEKGFKSYFITWEPWQTVPADKGVVAQGARQPGFTNREIAQGRQDEYILSFAKSIADSGIDTVYIRYAHEMNGDWYPWSRDSESYVAAWRHIVTLFKQQGATNAKFVFSVNPNFFQTDTQWKKALAAYYPGDDVVDYVGITMINFGSGRCNSLPCKPGQKEYPVNLFQHRATLLQSIYQKQLVIGELNTALSDTTAEWLRDTTNWIKADSSIQAVVLSQQQSRGAAQMKTGNLAWNISDTQELHSDAQRLARAAVQPAQQNPYTTQPIQPIPLLAQ